MDKCSKPLALVLPMLFTLAPSQAQQAPENAATPPSTITVYASRFEEKLTDPLPHTSIVTAAEIQRSGASNVSEVLSKVTGLPIRINLDGSTNAVIDMRGYGDTASNNVVVLLDGVRLSESEQAAARTSMIPIEAIAHIEITKTGNSVLYGDGATGGSINIVTKKNVGDLTVVSGGLASYAGHQSGVYHSRALEGSELSLFGRQYSSENYRRNAKGTEYSAGMNWTQHLDAQTDIGARFFTSRERNKLPGALPLIYLNTTPRETQVPGYNWNADVDTSSLTLFGKRTLQNIELAIDVNKRVREKADAYRYDAHEVYSGYNYDSNWRDSYGNSNSRTESLSVSPRIKVNHFIWANNTLQMGYDRLETSKDGQAFLTFGCSSGTCSVANNAGGNTYQIAHKTDGVYVRDVMDLSPNDRLSAGYRRESYSQNYAIDYGGYGSSYAMKNTVHASEFGYSKKFQGNLTGYLRLSENFRIPNADDNSNAATDTSYNPIPLQVQTSRDIDVGLNHQTNVWGSEVAYFRSHLKNEIGYDPVGCGYGCNVNYQPTRREGIHLRQKLQLSRDVTLRAQLQYVNAKFVEGRYSGNTVPGVAALSGQLSLDYQWSAKEQLTFTTRFAESRFMSGDFSNSQAKVPGYGVLDLSYFYKEKNWSVVASAMNLLDKPYSDSGIYKQINTSPYKLTVYPNPGRSFSLTGRYAF